MLLYSSDKCPVVQLMANIQQVLIFKILRNLHNVSIVAVLIYITNSAWGFPFFTSSPTLVYALSLHVYHPEVTLKFSLWVISESGSWSLCSASLALLHPWVVQEWVWSLCRFMHRNRNPFRPLLFVFSSTQTFRGHFFHFFWRERQCFL